MEKHLEEDRIDFETAKLAKRAGLNEKSLWNFDWMYNESGKEEPMVGASEYQLLNKHKWFVKCTQSHLNKWLRKNHKMHVYVDNLYRKGHGFCESWVFDIHRLPTGVVHLWSKDEPTYDSYEYAMEAGLKEALRTILKAEKGDDKRMEEVKNAVAISKGYPSWNDFYDWIARDGEIPSVVAQQIEAAMEEVISIY